MLFGGAVLVVSALLLLAYSVLDLATSRAQDVRGLPKPLWFVALLLPVVGPLLWLTRGRPRPGAPRTRPNVLPPSGRSASAPDDDEAFLRELRRRAEEQRRRGRREQGSGDDPPAAVS